MRHLPLKYEFERFHRILNSMDVIKHTISSEKSPTNRMN